MHLIAKYVDNAIELEGNKESLRALSVLLREVEREVRVALKIPDYPPTPYPAYVGVLSVDCGGTDVSISRQHNELRITGPHSKLGILADNIEFLAEQQTSQSSVMPHLHIEYNPGHSYLAVHSVPLVVKRSD
ncbi:MAG TPA: hypothetical protein VJS43_14605 [Candidatus Acidoferrales bacterium]|nr:hypothetical protein [Candidatus Acidoferrales bacterium]